VLHRGDYAQWHAPIQSRDIYHALHLHSLLDAHACGATASKIMDVRKYEKDATLRGMFVLMID
jgi:hypothetical protein